MSNNENDKEKENMNLNNISITNKSKLLEFLNDDEGETNENYRNNENDNKTSRNKSDVVNMEKEITHTLASQKTKFDHSKIQIVSNIINDANKCDKLNVQDNYIEKEFIINRINLNTPEPSDANFILVKVQDANALYTYLSANEVIVRNRHKDVNCSNCLRFTIGTPEENAIVLNLLKQYQS